jgi:hypothetical protein
MNNIQITLTKKEGKLLFRNQIEEKAYNDFISNLPEGAQADIFMSTDASGKSTNAQIAKIHKSIRDLAAFTGNTFQEMKEEIKKRAGLYSGPASLKSFADCSKEEINLAIQAAIEIGDFTGINLR